MLLVMVIPIIALFTIKLSKGLIRISGKKASPRPNLALAFLFPACGIIFRAINDYDIFNYENVWLPTISITVIFLLVMLFKQKEITFKKKDSIFIGCFSIFLFCYGFGTVIHYNCYYDKSESQHYTTKIIKKSESGGKSTTYTLRLLPWGPKKRINKVSVDRNLFNRVEKGEKVNIYFYPGNLNIPWFIVSDE